MTQVLTWNSGNNENIAIYQFSDDHIIEKGSDRTVIYGAGGQEELIISDVNSSNVNHFTDVDEPESEYYGYKWFYTDADGWTLNEDWIDPRIEESE